MCVISAETPEGFSGTVCACAPAQVDYISDRVLCGPPGGAV